MFSFLSFLFFFYSRQKRGQSDGDGATGAVDGQRRRRPRDRRIAVAHVTSAEFHVPSRFRRLSFCFQFDQISGEDNSLLTPPPHPPPHPPPPLHPPASRSPTPTDLVRAGRPRPEDDVDVDDIGPPYSDHDQVGSRIS